MASKKPSPNRRKSIAVTNQNRPVTIQRVRRRAHSTDRLSPLAKARRSLVPRKSILKTFSNIPLPGDSPQDADSQAPGSSVPTPSTEDDMDSMDFTRDIRAPIRDNSSRKSFGRRVSFAQTATIRVFQKANKDDTNTPGSFQAGPSSSHNSVSGSAGPNNDENAYPGASKRRRSSVRRSYGASEGEQSMDIDDSVVIPSTLLVSHTAGSTVDDNYNDVDDGEHDDDDDDDDMDVTEAIQGNIFRKRSLSTGPRRPPSLQGPSAPEANESVDQSMSLTESDIDPDRSELMEFTVPVAQSLRPPAHTDEAWLALRQATHSGDTPLEMEPSSDDDFEHARQAGGEMDLDDAMERIIRARSSLPGVPGPSQGGGPQSHAVDESELLDDTISSAGASFENEHHGDHTLNISKILGRVSDYPNSTMDGTNVYGDIPPATVEDATPSRAQIPSTAQTTFFMEPPAAVIQPLTAVFQPPTSVFQRPGAVFQSLPSGAFSPPQVFSTPKATISKPFSFTPRPPSPSKSRPNSPSKSRPASPSKPKPTFSAAFAPPVARPSPKKHADAAGQADSRQAIANDDRDANATSSTPQVLTMSSNDGVPKPSLRRPSGYFARRKSMAVASPKKKAGIGLGHGRASVGASSGESWSKPRRVEESAPQHAEHNIAGSSRTTVALIASTRGDVNQEDAIPPDSGQAHAEVREQAAAAFLQKPSGDLAGRRQSVAPPSKDTPTNLRRKSMAPSAVNVPEAVDVVIDNGTASRAPNGAASNPTTHFSQTPPDPSYPEQESMSMDEDAPAAAIGEGTEQWRAGVEDGLDEEGPSISIEQFMTMTGVGFMDGLTAPRRSSMHPRHREREAGEIPLAEYFIAMTLDVPRLTLYSHVARDLRAWMAQSREVYAQAEEEAAKVTPELFREYAMADEEGQRELQHQLNLFRTNARQRAKSEWYGWKLQWIEGLCETAEKGFNDLEKDAKALETINSRTEAILPELQAEYDQVMQELEKEQAEVTEIESCDQDYLNELKTSIAEQNLEVEALRAEAAEGRAKLEWLGERLAEMEREKQEQIAAIAEAQKLSELRKNGTGAEVLRLKNELEALEDLHMFRATTVHAELFEYEYASQFRVSIPCEKFVPLVARVTVARLPHVRAAHKDAHPRLSDFLLRMAQGHVASAGLLSTRQIVHRLADYWSACTQLRAQLRLVEIKCPLEIVVADDSFRAQALLFFPRVKAKAFLTFVFDKEVFSRWPIAIGALQWDVRVAYGPVYREQIYEAIGARLRQATPQDSYACLLDACMVALELYQ